MYIIQAHTYYTDSCVPGCLYSCTEQPLSLSRRLSAPGTTHEWAEKTGLYGEADLNFSHLKLSLSLRKTKHTMPWRSKAFSTRKQHFSADARGIKQRRRTPEEQPHVTKDSQQTLPTRWRVPMGNIQHFKVFPWVFKILIIKYQSSETVGADTRYMLKEVKDLRRTQGETG